MHKVGILRQDIAGIISETADSDYVDFGPQFVVDHKAKRDLTGNLTVLIQCFGSGTREKCFFEIYPTQNCGLDCSKEYS